MGKKNKRSQDEPELESELDPTTRVDGDSKKKKQKKKRSHDDPEMEPEQKMSLDGDAKKEKKKKKKKKSKNQEEELELEPGQTKIQEEEKRNDDRPTVSIAIAGSIIHNTQSLELASRLAGQISRAATIFRIDEIVVFDNKSSSEMDSDSSESGASFLVRILKYLETPQYLRKSLFPKQNDLRYVGMLPPVDAPHHLRKHEWEQYREGSIKDVQ